MFKILFWRNLNDFLTITNPTKQKTIKIAVGIKSKGS